MAPERLQKLLARAGVGSRRACEEVIAAGRVTVDGRVVTEPGTKADPAAQDVRLDGQRLKPEPPEYWILNKPKGVVCTNFDPAGRRRPVDFMTQSRARLFPVGRLDADSKGLLLMTNDGEFANRLTHPRYEVPKTYLATVSGPLTANDLRRLVRGVYLSEGRTRGARVQVLKRGHSRSTLEITIHEGRKRQVRRMLARLGHPVRELVRTRVGRISLRGLGVGKSRRLTDEEVEYLRQLPETPPVVRPPRAPQRGAERAGAGGEGPPRPARPRRAGRGERGPRRPPDAGKPPAPGAEPPHPFEKGRRTKPAGKPFRRGRDDRGPKDRPWEEDRQRGRGRPQGSGAPPRPHGRGRDAARKKRSHGTHDTDGVGQAGQGHRGRGGRGEGGGRGRRGPSPGRRGRAGGGPRQ